MCAHWRASNKVFSVIAPQCKVNELQKKVLPGLLVRLLLFVTDPLPMGQSQREGERGGKESKERGGARRGTESADKERERNQGEGEKVSVDNERETQTERREERAVTVVLSHSAALH